MQPKWIILLPVFRLLPSKNIGTAVAFHLQPQCKVNGQGLHFFEDLKRVTYACDVALSQIHSICFCTMVARSSDLIQCLFGKTGKAVHDLALMLRPFERLRIFLGLHLRRLCFRTSSHPGFALQSLTRPGRQQKSKSAWKILHSWVS